MLVAVLALALSQAPVSACPVSDEQAFATTKEHAVQVGGGAASVAARERRYLDALRGPGGEPLQFKRTGSMPLGPNDRTILDAYEVTYAGLDKPIVLYLDAYHYDDGLKAPKGFICAVPIALGPPGPDPFLATDSQLALALEQGAQKEFAPIPLDADGTTTHGVLFDAFRMIARLARTAAAEGKPIDPNQPPPNLQRHGMVVVAFPLRCGEALIPATGLDIVAGQGPAPRRDDLASGETLARLLPRVDLPRGSIAATFQLDRPRAADTIKIAYPESGCGPSHEAALTMKYTNAKPLNTPAPALPPGQSPTPRPVRLQAVIDLDGAAQRVVYMGGPEALVPAAIDAVRGWTAEPARLNGAPIVTPVTLQVRFGPR